MVGLPIDFARETVGVFDCGVVFVCPLGTHETQGYGGFAAAAVAADGDCYFLRRVGHDVWWSCGCSKRERKG